MPSITPYAPEPDKSDGLDFAGLSGRRIRGPGAARRKGLRAVAERSRRFLVLCSNIGWGQWLSASAMLNDAARALRLVRAKAADWKIDPHRVGIMGSSAGGHLASTLLTHFDAGNPDAEDPIERQSSRPDIGILCYPVITMGEHTHQGSKNNLLGKDPPPELVKLLSNELQVTKQTAPCFLFHTSEDTAVPVENPLAFAAALRKAGVPFDLHIYQKGRHGIGLGDKPPFAHVHPWANDCLFLAQGAVIREVRSGPRIGRE